MGKLQHVVFTSGQLESICKALGNTYSGLKGSEIGHMLAQIGVEDSTPTMTKWKRLYNALGDRQNQDQSGDRVFSFIAKALEPARFAGRPNDFHAIATDLNVTLAYVGVQIQEDGKFHTCDTAKTMSEAETRADRVRALLTQRGIHTDVIKFCRKELMQDDCFHAVLEASKSVADKIRRRTGLTSDGADLAQEAFGGASPLLRINNFTTDTEKGEQRGFVNLAKGLFGTFRNPPAHAPRISWPMTEPDALDLFSLASYVHRRIDDAKP